MRVVPFFVRALGVLCRIMPIDLDPDLPIV
jgi:hypothetical protein